MKTSLPTANKFYNLIVALSKKPNRTELISGYILSLKREFGRPRIMGQRSEAAELKISNMLFTIHADIARKNLQYIENGLELTVGPNDFEGIVLKEFERLGEINEGETFPNLIMGWKLALTICPDLDKTFK